jgi:hypothetical protein
VKKVIELLEEAERHLQTGPGRMFYADQMYNAKKAIEEAIAELQNPEPITPDQYREIEGEEYPDAGAVYRLYTDNDGMSEWYAEKYRCRKRPNIKYKLLPCVCAYNLTEPPPADWRPE